MAIVSDQETALPEPPYMQPISPMLCDIAEEVFIGLERLDHCGGLLLL